MTTCPVLVVAAGGNVAGAVASSLVDRDVPVRAAGRDTTSLQAMHLAAEVVRLDPEDPATFDVAVAGVERMFLLRPPPIARVGPTLNRLVDVAVAAGASHVVFSSVAGAESNRIVPHHRVETHLHERGVDHTILRPGFFAQNIGDAHRDDVVADDRLFVPAGDGRVAFVDVRDVGEVAADILADPTGHVGAGYQLTGPAAVTFDEVVDVLSRKIARPVRYQPATVLGYARHLLGRCLSATQVVVQTLLHVGLRRGDAATVDPTLGELLGRRARTIGEYVADHVHLWQRSA